MTACGSIGALMVGGRVVGQLKCELEPGHDEPVHYHVPGEGLTQPHEWQPGTPHRVVLEWADTEHFDVDLFDPAEHFDVDVPTPEAPVPFTSAYRAEAEATEARRVIGLGGTSFEPEAPQTWREAGGLNFPPTYLDRADLYGEE